MRRLAGFITVVVALGASAGNGWGAAPGNDNFANATAISGASGCQAGTNVDATNESGEPGVAGNDAHSVWYAWTAPSNAAVTFRTFLRTMQDSTLGIYTGGDVANLTLVTPDDPYENGNDDWHDLASSVSFTPTANTVYRIRVAAYNTGEDGTFALQWGGGCPAPGNDNFASATTITGTSGSSTAQTNEAATIESGELDTHNVCIDPADCTVTSDLGGTSVWYSWTAPQAMTVDLCVRFRSDGSDLNSVVGVYTGALGTLTEVAYATQPQYQADTCTTFEAASGTTYKIGVGSSYGAVGAFDLEWGDLTAPTAEIAAGSGQANPTGTSPVTFAVTFSEVVTGFTNTDVDLSSSSATGIGTPTVTDTGDHKHYTVDVPVTGDGDVVAFIPAGAAEDAASNPNEASGSASITYDSTDPSWATAPTFKVQGSKVTITFAASDLSNLTYTCKLDSGSFDGCSSPQVFEQLTKGDHTVTVRATDGAGNYADTPVNFTIKSGKYKP